MVNTSNLQEQLKIGVTNGESPIVRVPQLTQRELAERLSWIEERQMVFTANCQICNATGKIAHYPSPEMSPNVSIPVTCHGCDRRELLRLVAELIWRNVQSDYRFATFKTLQPSDKSSLSLEQQQLVLDYLKANRASGYAFFGPPGIGKTVWTTALYTSALWQQVVNHRDRGKYFPIWRITNKRMLDEHAAYATTSFESELDRKINQPTITAAKINHIGMKQGEVPRLFLEEIDKVKETDSRRAVLFEILDALQANGGQLVINSNLTPEEFAEKFGADLWWRIQKMTKVISLF